MSRAPVMALGVQMLRQPEGRAEHPVWLSPCGPLAAHPPGAHGHRLRIVPYPCTGVVSGHG